MGTPAITIIKNSLHDGREVKVAQIYRHFDGYPSEHGRDIANALIAASRREPETWKSFGREYTRSRLNNRNWGQSFLMFLCAADADLEFIGAESEPYSCNYVYEVVGDYDELGGKWEIGSVDYLERVQVRVSTDYPCADSNRQIFYGNAVDFNRWVHEGGVVEL